MSYLNPSPLVKNNHFDIAVEKVYEAYIDENGHNRQRIMFSIDIDKLYKECEIDMPEEQVKIQPWFSLEIAKQITQHILPKLVR